MKRILRSLLIAAVTGVTFLGASLMVLAETDPETGKEVKSDVPAFKYIQEDGSLTVIEYYGGNTYSTIVIPNAIGDPVSEIRSGAFQGADPAKVNAVYLPDTMMKIGENAFRTGMRIVVYPSGDYRAFASHRMEKDPDVSALTVKSDTKYGDVVVSGGVQYRLDGIEATVVGYEGAGGEVRVLAEAGGLPVTTVASGALTDSKITKLYLPGNVTTVEENAVGPFEVIFRADTDDPVIPTETPHVPESAARPVETGSADIGTFDMSLEEFVTTGSPETEDASTEEEESGSEEETEEASGEKDADDTTEEAPGEEKGDGKGVPGEEPSGEDEPAKNGDESKQVSPWLFVGIGLSVVALAGVTVAVVREMRKRNRRKNRGK